MKLILKQDRKLIAINDRKTSARRGAKRSEEERRGAKRSEDAGFHTLLWKLLSTSIYRILDFPNDPKGYIYGGKSKYLIENKLIRRCSLDSPLFN